MDPKKVMVDDLVTAVAELPADVLAYFCQRVSALRAERGETFGLVATYDYVPSDSKGTPGRYYVTCVGE